MDIPDQLRCLLSAPVERRDGSYIIDVPEQEVQIGDLEPGQTYRVAILSSPESSGSDENHTNRQPTLGSRTRPVEEGERRTVEIEDIGEQGDGLSRVEGGFVVIVPETEQGDRVTVEITDVQKNVAFAEVVERAYYDE